jgi:hypothetical protein
MPQPDLSCPHPGYMLANCPHCLNAEVDEAARLADAGVEEWPVDPAELPLPEDPFVPPETRVLLVKPGDVLVIGNVGASPADAEVWAVMMDALTKGLQAFGIYPVVFESDVDLAAVRDGVAQWNPGHGG